MSDDLRSSTALPVISIIASLIAIALAMLSDSFAVFAMGGIALILGTVSRAGSSSTIAVIVAVIALAVEVTSRFVMFA